MTDDRSAPPSPWSKRMRAKLKRLVGQRIKALESRSKERQGSKPWGGKKSKALPAAGRPETRKGDRP